MTTTTTGVRVPFAYLKDQFALETTLRREILKAINGIVDDGDFTLGSWVRRFEDAWCEKTGTKYAVGVSNGTDALALVLRAHGIGQGDTVLTVPNSFIATAGAILQAGATPAFVDVGADYLIDWRLVPNATIRHRAIAIIPVDLTGNPAPLAQHWQPMPSTIIRDSAQAVGASYDGQPLTRGVSAATYSLHPLKNVNGWTDSGVVATDDEALAKEVRLLRNHGLQDRDTAVRAGYNHRISTIAACVGWHTLQHLEELTAKRQEHAAIYDKALANCSGIILPPRNPRAHSVYHTYVVMAKRRDELKAWLQTKGIESKVHYPRPIHLQPGYAFLGYGPGSFPVAEAQANLIITLPCHEFLSREQVEYTIEAVRDFYR